MDSLQTRALQALLGMQRHSWEQGLLGQALLDLEQWPLAEVVARNAVTRQTDDGRLAEIEATSAVNSAAAYEVVAWASRRDESLAGSARRQVDYLLHGAPRAADGTIFHLVEQREVWVDSVYMLLPCLVAAGEEAAAVAQFHGHRERLFDAAAGLWSWRYDEPSATVIHPQHWGTGSGWVVAAIARACRLGMRHAAITQHATMVIDALLALRQSDGSFHNIVDDRTTFEENTVGMMLGYGILCGTADGWLGEKYRAEGLALIAHARTLVDDVGYVQRVCGSPVFDQQGTSPEAQAFFLLGTAAAN